MNARFYDANTGRFLSQDAWTGDPSAPWTQHLYAYAGNNPINFIDPTGYSFYILDAFFAGTDAAMQGDSAEDIVAAMRVGLDKGYGAYLDWREERTQVVETPEEPSKKVYKKRDDAAKAAQKKAKGLSRETGREYAYAVYELKDGTWAVTPFVAGEPVGTGTGIVNYDKVLAMVLDDKRATQINIALGHSHVRRLNPTSAIVKDLDTWQLGNVAKTGGASSTTDLEIVLGVYGRDNKIIGLYTGYENYLEYVDFQGGRNDYYYDDRVKDFEQGRRDADFMKKYITKIQ